MPNGTALPPAPPPSWRGYPQDAEERYLAFVLRDLPYRRASDLKDAQNRLRNVRFSKEDYVRAMQLKRSRIVNTQHELELYRQKLVPVPPIETLEAELVQIQNLPNVIGTRIDSEGCLVVQVRVAVIQDGQTYDIGDYEIPLTSRRNNDGRLGLTCIRKCQEPNFRAHHPRFAHETDDYHTRVHEGYFTLNDRESSELIRLISQGSLYQYVVAVVAIVSSVEPMHIEDQPPQAAEPEPRWSGFVPNPQAALAKTWSQLINSSALSFINELERILRSSQDSLRSYAEAIREYNVQQNALEAEIRKLERPQGEIAEAKIREEFNYIRSLKGVLGMRFEFDGMPVIHLRATHELGGRRFFLGDYEICFRRNTYTQNEGVLETSSTSFPNHSPYWHGERVRTDNGQEGWFCFGNHANEVRGYLNSGQFGLLVHLVAHSFRSVNEYDRNLVELARTYLEIRRGRLRPRRQPRPKSIPEAVETPVEHAIPAHQIAINGLLGVLGRNPLYNNHNQLRDIEVNLPILRIDYGYRDFLNEMEE